MQVATFEIRVRITINNVSTSLPYLCDTQAIHYARGSELEATPHTILAQPRKESSTAKGKETVRHKGKKL